MLERKTNGYLESKMSLTIIQGHSSMKMFKVAVLLTCFNRKEKTFACLTQLFQQKLPHEWELSVFVCEDQSSDGTLEMLENDFPEVKVVRGNGQLYWGGGMRAAWNLAQTTGTYDFFLWLNDDTMLFEGALFQLWKEYLQLQHTSILVGACAVPGSEEFSYGGHEEGRLIHPNGCPQPIKFMNGNLVLIPSEIVERIGIISSAYTHYLGDYDYGLRAQKAGFPCILSSKYLASCAPNPVADWANPRLSIVERWRLANHTKGLAMKEFLHYKAVHYGRWMAVKSSLEIIGKVLHPAGYIKFRNRYHSLIHKN